MIQPTKDRLLVEPFLEEETIAGLEIVRDHRNVDMQTGKVLAKGPESSIPIGSKVYFKPGGGSVLRIIQEGKYTELRIFHEDTIVAYETL